MSAFSQLPTTRAADPYRSDRDNVNVERQTSTTREAFNLTTANLKSKCHPRRWIHVISSHLGLILLFLAYVILGAFIFKALEAPNEVEERSRLRAKRELLIETLWNLSAYATKTNGTQMMRSYLSEWEYTVSNSVAFPIEGEVHWSFIGAVFFSSATITTIGYGNTAPVTILGRIVCVFYAVMGVPLTLLVLSDIGALLARWGKIGAILTTRKLDERKKKKEEKSAAGMPTITVEDLGNRSTLKDKRNESSKFTALSQVTIETETQGNGQATRGGVPATKEKVEAIPRSSVSTRTWDRLMKASFTVDCSRSEPDLREGPEEVNEMKIAQAQSEARRDIALSEVNGSDSTINGNGSDSRRASGQYLDVFNKRSLNTSQESVQSDSSKTSDMSNVIFVPEPVAQNRRQMTMSRGTKPDVIVANDATSRFGVKESEIATFKFPVWLAFVILLLYLCAGGLLFCLFEKWSFFESFYFCFVSLSTIGFGDVIPENKGAILTLSIAYALLGLALTSMSISLASSAIMNSLRQLGQVTAYYQTRQWKHVRVYRSLYVRGRSLRRRFSSRRKGKAGQFASIKRVPKRGSSLRLPGKFASVRTETPNGTQRPS